MSKEINAVIIEMKDIEKHCVESLICFAELGGCLRKRTKTLTCWVYPASYSNAIFFEVKVDKEFICRTRDPEYAIHEYNEIK